MKEDRAAMKPDFAGFMAVEQSRFMRCGCRERVLERTAPVREALLAWRLPQPEACGRNACPGLRLQSGGWPPHMASWSPHTLFVLPRKPRRRAERPYHRSVFAGDRWPDGSGRDRPVAEIGRASCRG